MRLGSAAAVTFCVVAVPVWGQENPLPDLFSDMIDVRVVNVEAVVTDREGNRIRGLEADDFELLVDGEPVPVSYFTEVDEGYAQGRSEDGVGGVPSLVNDEPVGTSFLIFIDDLHAVGQHRNRVLDRLEQDLVLLTPADRVAIVAFDGDGLSRLTDWTSSRQEIGQALLGARERGAYGHGRQPDLGFRVRQTDRAVMAATATVRSFANAPGRKVMLLLAESWSSPKAPRHFWASDPIPANVRDPYTRLVHAANQVGYSLYPVDLTGWKAVAVPHTSTTSRCSSAGGQAFLSTSDSRGSNPGACSTSSRTSTKWTQPGHDALLSLARQTGGRPMVDSLRDRALEETVADTRSYYWLGFEAPQDEDDRLHEIKVRLVGHKKLRVRTREHYLDMSRGAEVTMLVEGTLLFGGSPGDQTLDVRFGELRKAGLRKIAIPIEVSIPLEDVELVPTAGKWMSELEFRVSLMDEEGARSETPVAKIPIAGSTQPQPGDVFVYETGLVMRKRSHRYVAAIYDPLSGAILSASGTVGQERPSR